MKRPIALPVLAALLLALCACGPRPLADSSQETPEALPTVDPSGAAISVPEQIGSIVVLAPSLTETVVALGLGDKLVGCDYQSAELAGVRPDLPIFDITNPDVEQLAALAPDVLLVSALSLYDQEAPYQPLMDAGVCVICVPTGDSIPDVKADIRFLAEVLGAPEAGEAVLAELDAALEELAAVAASIPQEERKRVYFEISPAPYLYSTGSGTYLDQMIEWVGGVNVLADQTGWLSVEGEAVVAADPEVIFTNVTYIGGPVEEILGRDGWAGVTAVVNGDVYIVDNMSSSLPNQNIVVAMRQMAAALYPDYFSAG